MKFELVEFPEADPPESAPEESEPEVAGTADADDDPVAGVAAATARLTARAHAEGERIDASLASLAAVLTGPEAGRWEAEPPDNFRARRFSKGSR